MKNSFRLTLILLVMILSACAKKQQEAPQSGDKKSVEQEAPVLIKLATDATWPPMEFINQQKEIVGFDIDVINAIAKAAKFQVEIHNTAWDGIFAGLQSGSYEAIISAVTITEERKKVMDFSKPYINAGQVLVVQKGNNSIGNLNDLIGLNVGAQIGTTGALAVAEVEGIELKNYDELGLAVSDLANGRLSAVVADTPVAADYVLNNKEYKDSLKIVGEPFTEEYYGIAVKKGNQKVLKRLNEGLDSIEASGELAQLKQKWLK